MRETKNIRHSVTRRSVMIGTAAAVFAAVMASRHALAGPSGSAAPALVDTNSDFLRISQILTGYADLETITAARLAAAFAQIAPEQYVEFPKLSALLRPGMPPRDALAAANLAQMRVTALAIVAAWYTGTAGSGPKAVTVSYRDALMQRPVADALLPPTYAMGGPGWWTAPPPDVGLARPIEPAPALAIFGTPGPARP